MHWIKRTGETGLRIVVMGSSPGVEHAYRLDGKTLNGMLGGNTGNLAFVYAIASHLGGVATDGTPEPVRVVPWHVPAADLRGTADLIVLACANQLGPHTDLGTHATNLEAIGLPVVALGLGAQAASRDEEAVIPDGTKKWLEVIGRLAPGKAPNIGVRGEYTLRQLERLGCGDRGIVMGCPSNFINPTDIAALVSARREVPVGRVAAAVGQPYWRELAEIERAVLDLVDESDGSCIVQHGQIMVDLGQGELATMSEKDVELLRAYFRPRLSTDEFALWCRRNMLGFGTVPDWMNWLKRHDFVVGPRFHGIMLAIQAGVPGGCITHDSRTAELCDTMGIPARPASEMPKVLTRKMLPELFPFDVEGYRTKRKRLAKSYIAILSGAGVKTSSSANVLAD